VRLHHLTAPAFTQRAKQRARVAPDPSPVFPGPAVEGKPQSYPSVALTL
jgi:hypothetical protein